MAARERLCHSPAATGAHHADQRELLPDDSEGALGPCRYRLLSCGVYRPGLTEGDIVYDVTHSASSILRRPIYAKHLMSNLPDSHTIEMLPVTESRQAVPGADTEGTRTVDRAHRGVGGPGLCPREAARPTGCSVEGGNCPGHRPVSRAGFSPEAEQSRGRRASPGRATHRPLIADGRTGGACARPAYRRAITRRCGAGGGLQPNRPTRLSGTPLDRVLKARLVSLLAPSH